MNTSKAIVRYGSEARPCLFRAGLIRRLARLEHGALELEDAGRTERFGEDPAHAELAARVVVHDPAFYRRVAFGGTLGAAESYLEGEWSTNDLTALIRVILRNECALDGIESGAARFGALVARVWSALRPNTRDGSRRNIRAHYDLGNDFFERMLDPTLSYSSAVYPRSTATLEEASRHKLELLFDKLELGEGDRLLEIGTGWGGLALAAAGERGAQVTTTTLSRRQFELASARVAQAGLSDRVTLLESDYRDLAGRSHKLVSVEMIEAIGVDQYDLYFARARELLEPGGLFALQSITIADRAYQRHAREIDFIKRYVFPGSSIPSLSALITSATISGGFAVRSVDDYGLHYARTLAAWRENLEPHRPWVIAEYGERFWRLWTFYLAYCEAGFGEGYLGVAQILLEKPKWRQS